MKISGKCSWFGGPQDTGMSETEPLAFIYEVETAPYLFLYGSEEALGRNLNPAIPYIACRWTYEDEQTVENLLRYVASVYNPRTGKAFFAAPADWGPGEQTGRVADLSPGLMGLLELETDDIVEVVFPVIYERKVDAEIVSRIIATVPRLTSTRGVGENKKRPHL